MKKTKIISFPRSGHCLVAMILSNYFGGKFKYCERYVNPELMIEINNETNVQKEHDFDLNIPFESKLNYIIQIRNPFFAIPSWYSLIKKERSNIDWNVFSVHALDFWNKFTNKWIVSGQYKIPIIYYEQLISSPYNNLVKIISTIEYEEANKEHLEDCINRENIASRKHSFVPEKEWEERTKNSVALYERLKNGNTI